jgi:hypothetical protein
MNPRMTDLRLLDHHDYTHRSELPLGYFDPRGMADVWYERRDVRWCAILILLAALALCWWTGGDLPNL